MSNSKLTAAHVYKYHNSTVYCVSLGISAKIDGVFRDLIVLEHNDTKHVVKSDRCQLLLTPLSAITDEHAIEVARIARPEITDYNHLLNIGWGIIGVIKDGYILPELGFKSITAILRKLCEFGYDCDNAISEGWAVDRLAFVK